MMDLLDLEFAPQYSPFIDRGIKTTTFRLKFSGKVGDVFRVGSYLYRVCSLQPISVKDACDNHFRTDGFRSSGEMRSALDGYYELNIGELWTGVLISFERVGIVWGADGFV